jgi:hypothetical protein
LSGAGSGALKGAAIGSVVPGIGTAIGGAVGGGIGLIKGFFGSKADQEAGEAKRAADIASGKLAVEKSEDTRGAHLTGYEGLAGQMADAGFMTLDPAQLEALKERRNYDDYIEAGAVDPNAGAASSYLSGLADDAFEYGGQLASNELISGGAGGVGTPDDPALQGGGEELPALDQYGRPING